MTALTLLNKPAGLSSFAALGTIKKTLGTGKVGHAGTLDPFATGLLVILSGRMTKAASLVTALDKEYLAVFRMGLETDSLDSDGRVVAEAPVPDEERLRSVLPRFTGPILQKPPAFSAIRIAGKRAYAAARAGRPFDMPERRVFVHSIKILNWEPPHLTLSIHCSKGTYIRSLARDLALAVDSRSHCSALERRAVGPFRLDDAVSPEQFTKENLMSPVTAFRLLGFPTPSVDAPIAAALRFGRPCDAVLPPPDTKEQFVLWVDQDGEPVALTSAAEGRRNYHIVFESS